MPETISVAMESDGGYEDPNIVVQFMNHSNAISTLSSDTGLSILNLDKENNHSDIYEQVTTAVAANTSFTSVRHELFSYTCYKMLYFIVSYS